MRLLGEKDSHAVSVTLRAIPASELIAIDVDIRGREFSIEIEPKVLNGKLDAFSDRYMTPALQMETT